MCLSFRLLRCKNTPQNSSYSLSQPCLNIIKVTGYYFICKRKLKEAENKEGARSFLTQLVGAFVTLHFSLALELLAFFFNGGARLLIIVMLEGSTEKVK